VKQKTGAHQTGLRGLSAALFQEIETDSPNCATLQGVIHRLEGQLRGVSTNLTNSGAGEQQPGTHSAADFRASAIQVCNEARTAVSMFGRYPNHPGSRLTLETKLRVLVGLCGELAHRVEE